VGLERCGSGGVLIFDDLILCLAGGVVMSLINDMLNDLDRRRAKQEREEVDLDWLVGEKTAAKNRFAMPLLASAVVGIFVAIAVALWQLQQGQSTAALDKLAATQQHSAPAVAVKSSPEILAEAASSSDAVIDAPTGQLAAIDSEDKTEPDKKQGDLLPVAAATTVSATTESARVKTVAATTTRSLSITDVPMQASGSNTQADNAAVKNVETNTGETNTGEINAVETNTVEKNILQKNNNTPISTASHTPIRTLSPLQRDRQIARQAEILIRAGKAEAAESQLRKQLATQVPSSYSAELLVSLYIHQQRFSEAEQLLSELLAKNTQDARLLLSRARLLLAKSEYAQAVAVLTGLRPPLNELPQYYEMLGVAARQNQQYELSVQTYQQLLSFDSSRGDWWVGMAIALDLKGDSTMARNAYLRAMQARDLSTALRDYAQQRMAVL
jgi:hypothetical protein